MAFVICWIDSDEDVIIMTKNSCRKCTETKLGAKIIKEWKIEREEIRETAKYLRRKPFQVKCECISNITADSTLKDDNNNTNE